MGWHVGVEAPPKGETRHIHIVPCSSPLFWVHRPSPSNTASALEEMWTVGIKKSDTNGYFMYPSKMHGCINPTIPISRFQELNEIHNTTCPFILALRSLVSRTRSPFFAACQSVHLPISPIAASRRVVGPLSLRVSPCYWKIRLRGLECWLGAGKSLVRLLLICNPKPNTSIVKWCLCKS